MRFVSVSFLFLGDDLICRFLRSLVNAQTNRFALRLARDSAPRGTLSRSRAFTAMGLWSYYVWRAVHRGPARRNATATPIPFEPKQRLRRNRRFAHETL